MFSADTTKNFFLYSPDHFIDNNNVFSAELSLSLDVIYHLVEDNIYKTHLTHVFESSSKFVAIYANNEESPQVNPHVKTRNFTKDIEVMFPEWSLLEVIEGEPTSDETIPRVDFFIFKKA